MTRTLRQILISCLAAAVFSTSASASSDNALNGEYLTCYCNIQDSQWSARCLALIQRNYSGPALSSIKKPVELSEFVLYSDGKPKWIYHPHRQLLGPERPDAAIEEQVDLAIRLSSPMPPPPREWPMPTTLVVSYDPRKPQPLQLAGLDHPGEQDCIVTKKSISAATSDRWAANHARKILERMGVTGAANSHTWAAIWFRLNPDGSIDDAQAIPTMSGRKTSQKETMKYEEQLKSAILAAKTFAYHGAPVAKNQPVGLVAVYHPDMPSVLTVHTFLFDRSPSYVILRKNK